MESPQKRKTVDFLRFIWPLVLALLIIAAPIVTQAIYSSINNDLPISYRAEIDLTGNPTFNHNNRHIVGEVELYYNRWIASEPETVDEDPILMQTPGVWTGLDKNGEVLPASGYASYRYVLKGLTPGSIFYAARNAEIPNRVYLNRMLSSSVGEPSKTRQSSFVFLGDSKEKGITVPVDGKIEVIMEVGDTAGGGARHLYTVYIEGRPPTQIANRIFSLTLMGFIVASMVFLVPVYFISTRRLAVFLTVMVVLVTSFHLASNDSLLFSMNLWVSVSWGSALSVIFFAGMAAALLIYARYRKFAIIGDVERAILLSVLGVGSIVHALSLGTGFQWIALIIVFSVPGYMTAKNVVAAMQGHRDLPFLIYSSLLAAYGTLAVLFRFDVFYTTMVIHPSFLCLSLLAVLFAVSFYGAYGTAIRKRDIVALQRRYRGISNRALAHLSNEKDTIATLEAIGKEYDRSLSAGDKKILALSSTMRKRLLALRKEKISIEEECELESALFEVHKSLSDQPGPDLLLDVEEGLAEVPPLIFEEAISEITPLLAEGEVIVIAESKRTVSLLFPSRISLSAGARMSLAQRCELGSINPHFRKGAVILPPEGKR